MTAEDELGDTQPASTASVPATNDRLARGMAVGRYVILETLGRGGMGVVYAAYDPELDRRIALKVVRGRVTDASGRARIRREAQALARSEHPNVITVYDVGDHGDGLFIAMEIVDGGTLRDWQARHSWRDVLAAYLDAGRGLAAAHARGLVHRDFKPENVLVSSDDRVRVTDFGLARIEHESSPPPGVSVPPTGALTVEGAVMGTLGYMSPEQCNGDVVDARSDQYAWCVALWEALYGARPFGGTTLEEVGARMLGPPPTVPDEPEVPKELGRALLRGLAADRDARWPAMEPLLEACTPAHPRRGRRLGLIVVGALAAAAIGAIVVVRAREPGAGHVAPCASAASRLAGIWDAGRRTELASRFHVAGRPDVSSVLGLATRDFDTYATTWAHQWDAGCKSPDRETDPLLYAQRMNCLERSLVDLQGITQAFSEADPGNLAASWQGDAFARWSTPLADCERVEAIRAMPPAPRPADRAEITRLIVEIHHTRSLARTALNTDRGSPDAAIARLDSIVERLDQLESPAAVEAAFWRASYSPHGDAQRTAIERTIALGRKYRNDRWLAFAFGLQLEDVLATTHDVARARDLREEMDRAYERSGGDPKHLDLRSEILLADHHYEDALAAIRGSRGPGDALDHYTPDHLSSTAVRILVAAGRTDEAVAEARRHLAYLEALWQGDHWGVADAHELLAQALMYAHDPAGALVEVHAALAMHARIGSSADRMHSAQLLDLVCAVMLGEDAERDAAASAILASGADPYEAAIELAPEWSPALLAWGVAHAKPGVDLDESASLAAYLTGDLAAAERYARHAPLALDTLEHAGDRFLVLALLDARRGRPIAPHLATLERFRRAGNAATGDLTTELEALVQAAAGDWPAVRALLEKAPLTAFTPESQNRATVDALLGRALVETHDAARAIPVLEHGLFLSTGVLYTGESANYLIPGASFALARALWDSGGDRVRARMLAARAVELSLPADRPAIETWLAAHPS